MHDQKRRRSAGSGGMGLPLLLTIIFLILKLTDVITWKWYWVFSPLWIAASLGVLFFLVIGFILLLAVVGIASASSGAIVGIKSWFQKQEMKQEDTSDDEQELT
ncbi:MAG: hypothetical protein ACTSO7_16515 [Candidatus Heimdallarchaeota archaeon]